MFVFWYCHKRGKEVRLAREAEAGGNEELEAEDTVEEEDDDDDNDYDDHLGADGKYEDALKYQQMLKDVESKADDLSRPTLPARPAPDPKIEQTLVT